MACSFSQRGAPSHVSMLAVDLGQEEGAYLVIMTTPLDQAVLPLPSSQNPVAVKALGGAVDGRTQQHPASAPHGTAHTTTV